MSPLTYLLRKHRLALPRCGAACVEMVQRLARGPIIPIRTKHSVLAVPNNTGGGMGQLIVHELAIWRADKGHYEITPKGTAWLEKLRAAVPADLLPTITEDVNP